MTNVFQREWNPTNYNMSLGVKLDHVKGPGPPGERLARVTFRGKHSNTEFVIHIHFHFLKQIFEDGLIGLHYCLPKPKED